MAAIIEGVEDFLDIMESPNRIEHVNSVHTSNCMPYDVFMQFGVRLQC